MKLFELMKLGHKNITAHKKRNFMTVVVISALFGLILGIHFLLQGLEDALQHEASRFTDGKTYVATYAEKACGGEKEKIKIEIGDNIIWTDALCKDGDAMIPIVEEKVKKYGGSVIGKETSYTHGGVYKVAVPYDLIKNFGEINMSLKQPGTIPIVTSSTNAQELNNIRIGKKSADEQKLNQRAKLRKKTLGKVYSPENDPTSQFSIVGLYPSGIDSLELAKLPDDLKSLYIVLGQVRFPYASNFIIDDGSESVKKYLGGIMFGLRELFLSFLVQMMPIITIETKTVLRQKESAKIT